AADVTFGIVRGGKVEIEDLAGSLDAVLPLAAGLGVSFEELGAVIVTATQRGGGFAQGMQAVRAVLTALTNASPEARAALEGVDFSSFRIRAQGLVPVLEDISRKLGGNTNAIRAVFPDGRALGAVLAVLSNESSGLSASLSDLVGSTGAVEDALGRRLQSPMVQLGIIVNQLRSQFGEALGGAFLRGVERAVEALGGMEATSKAVADVAKSLGSVFGAVFPAIASVIAEATRGLQSFIEGIGGADALAGRMKLAGDAIADVLGAALKIARAEVEALVRVILLIPQTIIAAKNELDPSRLNPFKDTATEARIVKREIDAVAKALLQIKGDTLRFGAFDQEEFQGSLRAITDELGSFGEDPANALRFKPSVDKEDLERTLASLRGREESIRVRVDAGSSFEELERSFEEAKKLAVTDMDAALAQMEQGLRGFGDVFTADVAAPAERTFERVKAELAGVTESIEIAKDELRFLGGTAARAFSELEGDELKTFLKELASRAAGADKALQSNEDSARRLKDELSTFVSADITETERSIRLLERTMRDAASQAALLGLEGDQAAATVAAVGTSEDEKRLEALRDKLAALRKELSSLRSSVPETLVVASKIQAPSFRDLFDQAIAGAKELASRVAASFDPGTLAQIGRESGIALREEILAGVGAIDPFEETLRLFRGGIEPSLERQVQLIDEQVDRQRDATDELRNALPVLRALGLLSEERIDLLDQETAKLAQSADLIRRRAALETAGLRRQGLELGINPKLDEAELRVQIEEARDLAERQKLAISLGVKVDDKSIVAAQQELQRRAEALSLRQVKREALYFGLAIDKRAPAQLEADIADARDAAQAFADSLGDRGVRSEAISLGISIDGRSTAAIERDIRDLQAKAQAFLLKNPVKADLLRGAIDGGSRALA
ncbi:MAG: phage tail tape measure protein, partial [Planctomycetota bacterium]